MVCWQFPLYLSNNCELVCFLVLLLQCKKLGGIVFFSLLCRFPTVWAMPVMRLPAIIWATCWTDSQSMANASIQTGLSWSHVTHWMMAKRAATLTSIPTTLPTATWTKPTDTPSATTAMVTFSPTTFPTLQLDCMGRKQRLPADSPRHNLTSLSAHVNLNFLSYTHCLV